MKIVKVTYTVQPSFVETNLKNVATFIADIKALNNSEIRYVSYLAEDGKTFVHMGTFGSDHAQQQFLALPSFRSFQQARNGSGLEKTEHIECLEVAAASYPLLA
ncbi:hypothetical protein C7T94_01060 [Pedobacter yulinensis]|uniref:ABM domain-containing protein n=1 Tax=Pedobacter yulinensis TaxID=2126353 RepID=A0A2T3HQM3_9SPHI|nr:hypothetical protein [Pedobacter yulinensis]PST84748.1 hypothetical protein C7T94_01060 [Pedobacter yulinensis]